LSLRSPIKTPICPFCQAELPRCKPGGIGQSSQFEGGVCSCGAIFGSDPRGNSLGALLVDVLLFAAEGDWERFMELRQGEDYQEAWLYGYNERLHHLVPNTLGPRRGVGTLFVVRLGQGS
jgi:hypothetical protein